MGIEEKLADTQHKLDSERPELAKLTEQGVFAQGIEAENGSKRRDALRRRIEDLAETVRATGIALAEARERAKAVALEAQWAEAERIGEEYRARAARVGKILDEFAAGLVELIDAADRFGRAVPRHVRGINSDFNPAMYVAELPTALEAKIRVATGERVLMGNRLAHRAAVQIVDTGNLELQADEQIAIAFKSRKKEAA
ncbi:MAG: hypothetical protein ACLQBA_25735 [Candidatus Binataceae bacterium]